MSAGRLRKAAWLTVAVVLLAGSTTVAAATGSYLVSAGEELPADLSGLVERAGGTVLRHHPEIGLAVVTSDRRGFAEALRAVAPELELTRNAEVKVPPAERPLEVRSGGTAFAADQASRFACQWNLQQTDVPGAWAQGALGDPDVKVAVLDTGIDPTHQDLVGKVDMANSRSVLSPGSSPCNPDLPDEESILDFHHHGTLMANIVTSNDIELAGVAPQTQLVAVKVLNCQQTGTVADVIAGLLYSASLDDVEVISLSFNFYLSRTPENQRNILFLRLAVLYATFRGKLVVAQAGDEGVDLDADGNMISVPAQLWPAVSVYATGNDDTLPSYSNHGVSGTLVGAPGGVFPNTQPALPGCTDIPDFQSFVLAACSTFNTVIPFPCATNTYLLGFSTGYSAAHVAGIAALLDGQAGGRLSPFQLRRLLVRSADDLGAPGTDNLYSRGRVNASRAVAAAGGH